MGSLLFFFSPSSLATDKSKGKGDKSAGSKQKKVSVLTMIIQLIIQ